MLKYPGPRHGSHHAPPVVISVAFEGAGTGHTHGVTEYPSQQNVSNWAGGVAQ